MRPRYLIKVLCVDKGQKNLAALVQVLAGQFEVATATSASKALEILENNGPFAVIISDMRMPDMDGGKFLNQVKQIFPDITCLLLTSNTDIETALTAINDGNIFRLILKPYSNDILLNHVRAAVNHYELCLAKKQLEEKTIKGLAQVLMDMISIVSPKFTSNMRIIQSQLISLAQAVGIESVWQLEIAIILSKIGYIAIPRQILAKIQANKPLSNIEKNLITKVPKIGHDLIAKIHRLEYVAKIILYQNKNFDGSGFPVDGITGEAIPMASRVLKILLDLSELQTKQLNVHKCLEIMKNSSGKYDPKVLKTIEWFFSFSEHIPILYGDDTKRCVQVSIKDLITGDKLLENIVDEHGVVILSKDEIITVPHIERLNVCSEFIIFKEPIIVERERRNYPRIQVKKNIVQLRFKAVDNHWYYGQLVDISLCGIHFFAQKTIGLQDLTVDDQIIIELTLGEMVTENIGTIRYCNNNEVRIAFTSFCEGMDINVPTAYRKIVSILENEMQR